MAKKGAKAANKVITKRASFWQLKVSWLVVVVILGIFAAILIVGWTKLNRVDNSSQVETVKPSSRTNLAVSPKSASPSAKSTPSPYPIPTNSGPSVRVPILTYHYIGNNPNPADKARDDLSVDPDKFDAQLGYLQSKGYTPITLDTLYAAIQGGMLPSKPIVLTFDDGYIDFYLNAFPILRKYGFRSVSFIPTGLMNQGYYMTWSQIKEIDASGLVAFEPHSVSHYNLAGMSGDRLTYQIVESKKVLESQLGKKTNFFAYPYGMSGQESWRDVKTAGFVGAVGTWYGTVESEGNRWDWPRVKISGHLSLADFEKRFP